MSNKKNPQVKCYAIIQNDRGLHARASAKFVKVAEQFNAEIFVKKTPYLVSGVSIMGLMSLAASYGTAIELIAEGKDSQIAIETLSKLIDDKFGEK